MGSVDYGLSHIVELGYVGMPEKFGCRDSLNERLSFHSIGADSGVFAG